MNKAVDQSAWLKARRELLDAEKALQRSRDDVSRLRRKMPARRLDSDYEFNGESGTCRLSELFGDRTQLLIYHFMFHPDWDAGCKSCSFWADSFDGAIAHLAARDVSFAVISRAPLGKLLAFRERMGWSFPWLSSDGTMFNYEFNVSFRPEDIKSACTTYNYIDGAGRIEELPGLSVFRKNDDGTVDHTYSTYARGLDALNPVYQLLDLTPKGRDEEGLPYPMDWVRRHDEY